MRESAAHNYPTAQANQDTHLLDAHAPSLGYVLDVLKDADSLTGGLFVEHFRNIAERANGISSDNNRFNVYSNLMTYLRNKASWINNWKFPGIEASSHLDAMVSVLSYMSETELSRFFSLDSSFLFGVSFYVRFISEQCSVAYSALSDIMYDYDHIDQYIMLSSVPFAEMIGRYGILNLANPNELKLSFILLHMGVVQKNNSAIQLLETQALQIYNRGQDQAAPSSADEARKSVIAFAAEASDIELQQIRHLQARIEFRRKGYYPRWGQEDLPDDLIGKTAPAFLKVIYASLSVDGIIDRASVREFDEGLMEDVDQYISRRITRGSSDLGDAEGLQFLIRPGKKRGRKSAQEKNVVAPPIKATQPASVDKPHRPRRKASGAEPSP